MKLVLVGKATRPLIEVGQWTVRFPASDSLPDQIAACVAAGVAENPTLR